MKVPSFKFQVPSWLTTLIVAALSAGTLCAQTPKKQANPTKKPAPVKPARKEASKPVEPATAKDVAAKYPVSGEPQMIDLATALRLAGAEGLDVQIAQQKLVEAKAAHEQARQQFFPWITPGLSYRRHDGQIQAVEGRVFDASKQSYTVGGAVNAQVDFGETWFKALAAKQNAKAAEHAVEAERLQAVLEAASGYFDLVRSQAQIGVAKESLRVSEAYAKQLDEAVKSGVAFKGDFHRVQAQTERYRIAVLRSEEQKRLVGTRLAQTLHLNPAVALTTSDSELVPMELTDSTAPLDRLIAQALQARPELARQMALMRAAKEEQKGTTVGPLIPSLSAQVFGGGLGGGLNDQWHNFDATSAEQLTLGWRIGPGGLLDRPRQKVAEARVKSASLQGEKLQDAVVGQVVEASIRVQSLASQMTTARKALAAAEETERLSRERKEFGVGAVLENIQAGQDLANFRNDYLTLVADYNKAQYTLRLITSGSKP